MGPNEPEYLVSISDLINTIHKMDAKLSKLYEVVAGDKDLGTKGIINRIHDLEVKVEKHESHKNKLIGVFIAASFLFSYIWEAAKNIFHTK
jgi:hypothetical protein